MTSFHEAHDLAKSMREEVSPTARATVSGIEELLYEPFKVLDHGFVRVVDYMGDDAAVVQAARVSYGKGTKQVSEDAGLIKYLMRHHHSTPFEMAEIKLHVKLPIFVARQWIRHRTASVNEYSARYSILDKEFYVPKSEHLAPQSKSNNQGRAGELSDEESQFALALIRADSEHAYAGYAALLNIDDAGQLLDHGRQGIARELARMNLNLGFYTQWYWKTNLHNLMNFLRLRADPHAQYEIRAYAQVILEIMKRWVPLTHAAFLEHRLGSATLSASALALIRRLIDGEKVSQEDSGLGKREWQEFQALLAGQQ